MRRSTSARSGGASYADVRVGRYRRQDIQTRERQVTAVADDESYGIGIRTLVNGCWGFAATSTMTRAGVQNAAREALTLSRAAKTVQRRPVELAPSTPAIGTWMTPIQRDPIEVPLEEKIALLLRANEAALKVKNVRFANSGLQLLREVKTLVTSEGTNVTQTFIRVGPYFSATAIATGDFQTYEEELAPRGQGWEYIESLDMPGNAERWASIAAEKLSAKSVEAGQYDLILDPTNLWLTIHESIGHPTELDRAIGQEANYAGTSFVAPPEKTIGKLKYGPAFMNVQADRTQANSLSRVAWDDEGVPADQWLIVEKGIFKDYQTTREQAKWIQHLTGVAAIAWVLVRRVVECGAVSAHAEHLAAARRARHHARRHRRGDRSRHRHQEPRIVVDRQPALQLPVLGSVVPRSAQRQDRGDAARRRLSEQHAGILERARHDWRKVVGPAGRIVLLDRQGRALAVQFCQSRMPAVPVPQRHHSQHGTKVMTREEARALADRVLAMSKADAHPRVNITSVWGGNTRFADAEHYDFGRCHRRPVVVTITVTIGRKRASATTNVLEEASLRRTVELAAQPPRLSPDDSEMMPELGPQKHTTVNAYIEDTANLNPVVRAGAVQRAIQGTGSGQILSAGFLNAHAIAVAVATSNGLFAYHRTTDAELSMTARTPDGTGSGWASAGSRPWGAVDPAALGRVAARKAQASRNPQTIEPRPLYTAVLEPQAVNDCIVVRPPAR